MARPGKAQASEDLWHLSIDDLFASPAEAATGPVTGPFVINLSLSTAPSGAMPRGMPRFDRLCVYQLQRKAGDREEFRLRLGIIQTELEADAILAAVREHYPAARKETASEEDATAVKTRAARAAMRLEQAKKAQARMQQAAAAVAERHANRVPKAKPAPSPPSTPAPSPPQAARQTWNVDDVLPQFAALAPVKVEPAKRHAVAKPRPAKRTPVANRAEPPTVRAQQRTKPAPNPVPPVVAPPPAPIAVSPAIAVTEIPVVESRKPEAPAEIVEITFSAAAPAPTPPPAPAPDPTPVATVSPPAHDIDSDPNAITAEVEAPTFMIDAPAPPHEPPVAELELTVEAQHLPAVAIEAVAIEAPVAEAPIELSLDVESSMTIEAPYITALTGAALRDDTVTTEAAHLEGSITIEAPHITLAETAEPVPVAPVAPVAVQASPERAFVDTITMEVPALEAAPVPSPEPEPLPAPPTVALEPVLTETDAVALLESAPSLEPVAVPPARSPEDSGSLERLVARIDSMVEELPAPKPIAMQADAPITIDSTQTQRALMPLELPDDEGSTNFVVQLILSEDEIDPDQVPSLDIFSEYRLYRIMGLDEERVMHALRLGFFSSEPAAQAVAGYLSTFFDSPSVTRVSVAERERFAQDRLAARKDVGATGVHSVIELTSPAPLPERRAREVVPSTDSAASPKSGSLWSRLVSPLKR